MCTNPSYISSCAFLSEIKGKRTEKFKSELRTSDMGTEGLEHKERNLRLKSKVLNLETES